jgi:hypothetical protein
VFLAALWGAGHHPDDAGVSAFAVVVMIALYLFNKARKVAFDRKAGQVTLETFNWLLAAGGGVLVPGGVGVFATWLVRKHDKPWRTALAASTNRALSRLTGTHREEAVHAERDSGLKRSNGARPRPRKAGRAPAHRTTDQHRHDRRRCT